MRLREHITQVVTRERTPCAKPAKQPAIPEYAAALELAQRGELMLDRLAA
jgi:hypothetical protein